MSITAEVDIKGWNGSPYLGSDTNFEVPYLVFTTDLSERETAILTSGVLPSRGDIHPDNAYCAAFGLKLKRNDQQPLLWHATVTYKTDSLDDKEKEKQQYPNPLDRPCEITWDAVSYTKIITATVEDYTPPGGTLIPAGTPIVNTALDPFDPPAEITDYRWVANVTKYVATVPTWILAMRGRVNNASYTIDGVSVDAMASRLVGIRIGKRSRENGINYRELHLTIEFLEQRESRFSGDSVPEPYILELLNEGYQYGSTTTARQRIRTPSYSSTGVINTSTTDPGCTVPHPLTIDGDPEEFPDQTTAVFLPFCVYRTADFSQLPLT